MNYEDYTEDEKSIINFESGYHLVTAPGGCGKTGVLTQRVINFLNDKRNIGRKLLCVTFTRGAAEEMLSRIGKALESKIHSSANELSGKFVHGGTDKDISTLHAIAKRLLEYYWFKKNNQEYQESGEKYPILSDAANKALISKAFYNVMLSPKHRNTNRRYNLLKKYEDHPLSLICAIGQRENVENLYYEAARRLYHTKRQLNVGIPEDLLLYPEYKDGKVPGIRKSHQKLISAAAAELERLKLTLKNEADGNIEENFISYSSDFDDLLCILWDFMNTYEDEDKKKRKIPPCYDWVQVDEVQDLSKLQLDIIRKLTKEKDEKTEVSVVYYGDINQAIFSFMGGCPENVLSIRDEVIKKGGDVTCLNINHRSSAKLVQYQRHFINAFFKDTNKSKLASDRKRKDVENPIEIHRYSTESKQNNEVVKKAISLLDENPSQQVAIICRTNRECINFEKAFIKKGVSSYRLSDETFSSMGGIHEVLNELETKYQGGFPEKISIYNELKTVLNPDGDSPSAIVSAFLEYVNFLENSTLYQDPSNLLNAISKGTMEDVFGHKLITSGVFLSTIHKAKGKGFETVIVPSVVEGVYPLTTSTRKEAILEDARLFYVAISRAIDKLILTYFDKGRIAYEKKDSFEKTYGKHKKAKVSVRTHMAADKIVETKPSRFIKRPRGVLCIE